MATANGNGTAAVESRGDHAKFGAASARALSTSFASNCSCGWLRGPAAGAPPKRGERETLRCESPTSMNRTDSCRGGLLALVGDPGAAGAAAALLGGDGLAALAETPASAAACDLSLSRWRFFAVSVPSAASSGASTSSCLILGSAMPPVAPPSDGGAAPGMGFFFFFFGTTGPLSGASCLTADVGCAGAALLSFFFFFAASGAAALPAGADAALVGTAVDDFRPALGAGSLKSLGHQHLNRMVRAQTE